MRFDPAIGACNHPAAVRCQPGVATRVVQDVAASTRAAEKGENIGERVRVRVRTEVRDENKGENSVRETVNCSSAYGQCRMGV